MTEIPQIAYQPTPRDLIQLENCAVMAQNLTWFEHYLLGKELMLPE